MRPALDLLLESAAGAADFAILAFGATVVSGLLAYGGWLVSGQGTGDGVAALRAWPSRLRSAVDQRFDRLGEYLDGLATRDD